MNSVSPPPPRPQPSLSTLYGLLREAHAVVARLPACDGDSIWEYMETLRPEFPTFGGQPIPRDEHIWSWDAKHMIVGDRRFGFVLVPRGGELS